MKRGTPARLETLKEARKADRINSRLRELAEAVDARAEADRRIRKAVDGLRRDRVSWRQIAGVMNLPHTAVFRRFRSQSATPKTGEDPHPVFDL